jgi:uncharacterized Tic20 family protein
MARFQSREEYERWRTAQNGGTPAPAPAAGEAVRPEQLYDGPPPGSNAFVDRSRQHAGLSTDRDRKMAMLCHLTALSGFIIPFGNVLGPVVIWMMGKSDSQFVDEHGKASLNFQVSLTLYFIAVAVFGLFLGPMVVVLILVAGIAGVYGLVMTIVNAIKAHNGEEGEYALSTRFLR